MSDSPHLKVYALPDLTFYEVLKAYSVGSYDKEFGEWYYRVAAPGQFIVVDCFHNISILTADEVKRVLNERNRK